MQTILVEPVDVRTMSLITVILPMLFNGKRLNRGEGLVQVACQGGYLAYMWPQ